MAFGNLIHVTSPDKPLNKEKSKYVVVKAAKNNVALKRKPGRPKSKRALSDNSSEDSSLQTKAPLMKMYAFPVFDKCDSTVFLPTSLSKHLNTGDMKAVSNLLSSRLDKNCAISFPFFAPGQINVRYLIKAFEIISELHPDMIACASNTTVSDNIIKASIHTKYTECKAIHDSVRQTITDPMFATLRTADRVEELQHELERENRSQEDKDQFLAMAAAGTDLLVYIHLELEMAVDDLTKKVSRFSMSAQLTSMHPVLPTSYEDQ